MIPENQGGGGIPFASQPFPKMGLVPKSFHNIFFQQSEENESSRCLSQRKSCNFSHAQSSMNSGSATVRRFRGFSPVPPGSYFQTRSTALAKKLDARSGYVRLIPVRRVQHGVVRVLSYRAPNPPKWNPHSTPFPA